MTVSCGEEVQALFQLIKIWDLFTLWFIFLLLRPASLIRTV